MSRLLHVVGSPRGAASVSCQMSEAFLSAWRESHPDGEVDTLDLWAAPLPPFAGQAVSAKLKTMIGMPADGAEQAAFDVVHPYVQQLLAADAVLVSAGMWNFSVPYVLKQWIDIVAHAGLTFRFTEHGYVGLVTGRPLQLLLAGGGDYSQPPMSAMDHMTPYLQGFFGFIGFTDIRTESAWGTAYPPEISGPAIEGAIARAALAGAAF